MTDAAGWPSSAAIVGSGTMGCGFAQLLALAGVEVAVIDVSAELADTARQRAISAAAQFAAAGMMPADAELRVAERVTAHASIADGVSNVDLVIEAVTEDLRVKAAVLAEIERCAPAHTVIASNTSAIPIADMAAGLTAPERFLGTHWFNPPQWVPLVEIIPGTRTSPAVIDRVQALLRRLGKRPVTVGDAAGFVANRIQFAMFKEAASVVADGVASAEQVDEVVRMSFGFRLPFYGPFAIADMAGLDVYSGAYTSLEADLGARFSPPPLLSELVAEGDLGTKTGRGFLPPDGVSPQVRTDRRDRAYYAMQDLLRQLAEEE
jgi:3-hydroxybutyryl-CoA dehydrogenase